MTLSTFENPWRQVKSSIGMSLIDHLYNRLDGMYTSKWRAAFPSIESIENWKAAWSDAFIERRLSPEQIKRGLANCLDLYDWPPSLTEFVKACEQKSRDEQITPIEDPARLLTQDIKPDPAKAEAVMKMARSRVNTPGSMEWVKPILANPKNYASMAVKMAKQVAEKHRIAV